MKLRSERLLITDLSLAYLNEIHQLHSLPEVDEFNTLGIPASIQVTKELILDWLEQKDAKPRLSYVFCIKLIETNQFIGLIGLKIGKLNYRTAETWFKLHPDFWNKGYTSEALQEILKLAFHKLKLHRVEAGCAVGNIASIRVLEKAGMTREGMKRQILPIRGKWVDNYFYSILEQEFDSNLF